MIYIKISDSFTKTPGARYRTDGPFSGEEFRESLLDIYFSDPNDKRKIDINLDDTEGYATSFLEEAFGGLARKYGKKACENRLRFISEEEPLLIDEIWSYIRNV